MQNKTRGRWRRPDSAQGTVVSQSCLSPSQSILPRLLPASPGKNHSLSIPPAQLTECHAARRATLQHLLAGPPLPWQCCQGSDVFFHPDFCRCFIFTPFGALLSMPVQPASRGTWERVRICSAARAVVTLHEVLAHELQHAIFCHNRGKAEISKLILINPPLSLHIRLNHREEPKRPETFLPSEIDSFLLERKSHQVSGTAMDTCPCQC